MRSRNTITEIFSTFIQFDNDLFGRWTKPSLRLVESINDAIEENDSPENDKSQKHLWALYWHQAWKESKREVAFEHLRAYLQDAAYHATYKFISYPSKVSFRDQFQLVISNAPRILNKYDFSGGANISTFAQKSFGNALSNYLKKRGEVNRSTDWSILRRETDKGFRIALLTCGGLKEEEIQKYLFARKCFKEHYAATGNPLPPPDKETWDKITDTYNKERSKCLPFLTSQVSRETLEGWLRDSVKFDRNYFFSPITSLDLPSSNDAQFGDGIKTTKKDFLPANEPDMLWQLATEDLSQEISSTLKKAVSALSEFSQKCLYLCFKEGKSQTDAARELGCHPSKVNRAVRKSLNELFDALLDWVKTEHGADQEKAPQISKGLSALLEDCLRELL